MFSIEMDSKSVEELSTWINMWTVSILITSRDTNIIFKFVLGTCTWVIISIFQFVLSWTNNLCYLFKTFFPMKLCYLFSSISHISMLLIWNAHIRVLRQVKRCEINHMYFVDSNPRAYSLMFVVFFWEMDIFWLYSNRMKIIFPSYSYCGSYMILT